MKLEGKVSLVTGASRGIGKAIALKLTNLGSKVAVNYHEGEVEANRVGMGDNFSRWRGHFHKG